MKRIGHYIIRGLLGRGGMGKVFKVELPVVGKMVALKLLDPDPLLAKLLGMPKLRDLFLAEAKILARLNHPHIVDLNDFDEDQGRPFYVMAYYPNNLGSLLGESYRTDRPSRTIRADKALNYVRQTLEGLACLHDAGIVHRDIKPFNLLVTELDSIKICDFGLSKLRGERFSRPAAAQCGFALLRRPGTGKVARCGRTRRRSLPAGHHALPHAHRPLARTPAPSPGLPKAQQPQCRFGCNLGSVHCPGNRGCAQGTLCACRPNARRLE
jgi:serine/threonine protein kinase